MDCERTDLPTELLFAILTGLENCSEFVARMDVDDICEPNRLGRQLQFMLSNSNILVLGTQAAVFAVGNDDAGDDGGNDNYNASSSCSGEEMYVAGNIPTHPVLVQWEMMFRCAVLHPTVMFRRSAILECGGYSNHLSSGGDDHREDDMPWTMYVEDYFLWERVLSR